MLTYKKILFIDRDGTLIKEPEDEQIDSLDKIELQPNIIPGLLKAMQAGYQLVMVTNQDGLGTESFPQEDFEKTQQFLLGLLSSQGITFSEILICPHFQSDNCSCRKPNLGLVVNYLAQVELDRKNSYVIGDRQSDIDLANNMQLPSILYQNDQDWLELVNEILNTDRCASIQRKTNETNITASINIDKHNNSNIETGISFLDHMLEQLAKHGSFSLQLKATGDLNVDDHHTIEDIAITLGEVLRQALGDKKGIGRYGFLLPMDESLAQVAIDICARPHFKFCGQFSRETINGLSTEMIPHFFRSFADSLGAAIHIQVAGENTHHMIEAIFKAMGRALQPALASQGYDLPSTKGSL